MAGYCEPLCSINQGISDQLSNCQLLNQAPTSVELVGNILTKDSWSSLESWKGQITAYLVPNTIVFIFVGEWILHRRFWAEE
jgi:hypothetical protein